jgi:peptidylprolyl isomerase
MPGYKRLAPGFAGSLLLVAGSALCADAPKAAPQSTLKPTVTMADILATAPASAWRPLADEHTLYMELPAGRVIIELEPALAPHTVANIEAMARAHYYDGLSVMRVQDNYVAQWGDPEDKRTLPAELKSLAPEFAVPQGSTLFTPLADVDGYAPQAGFVDSFPAARDTKAGLEWLTHCYAAVGVGRDNDPTTGNGSELYAVIGNAPRHLDRNVTVVGRVRSGIELLSSLPRGTGDLGFYATPAEYTTIKSVRLASELPPAARARLEVLRTDTPTFAALVDSRRNRHDDWFVHPAGHIDLCNVPLPVRPINPPH